MSQEIDNKVIEHEHKIKTLEHRVDRIELLNEQVNKITVSIEKMCVIQSQMIEEQKELRKDVIFLKELPAKNAREVKQKVVIAIVTGVVSTILGAIIALTIK